MASSISLEFYEARRGAVDGFASLDGTGKVPTAQLPAGFENQFKGEYATVAALETAHPTANLADYAFVDGENAFYYWNSKISTPAWVNQNISQVNYDALTAAEKAAVPYVVGS